MEIHSLLVTTDFSEFSRKTYPAACALARKHGWTVHVAHVAGSLPPFCYLHAEGISTIIPQDEYFEELDRRLVEEVKGDPSFEGLDVTTHLLSHESPHEAIVEFVEERGVGMIIISTHGHTGWTHVLLGSVTEKVVRFSPVPVLTYREREGASQPYAPQRVLVPFDFSQNSRAVLPAVAFLAENYSSEFVFLFVLDASATSGFPFSSGALYESMQRAAAEAPKIARERFDEIQRREFPDIDAEFEIAEGIPAREIVERAKELKSDLILMGTHGWTGTRRFILGGVAEKTVRKAPCSVLTVRPEEGGE